MELKIGYGEPLYTVRLGKHKYKIGEELEVILQALMKDEGLLVSRIKLQKRSQTELLNEISTNNNISTRTLKRYIKKLESYDIIRSRLDRNSSGKIKILYINKKAEIDSPTVDTRHFI